MLNGIHFYSLMVHASQIPEEDIPVQLRNDFRGLVAEFEGMEAEAAEAEREAIMEAIYERVHGDSSWR